MSEERERLKRHGKAWKHWGPYLSERAWGTVREDYSPDGSAWTYFTHDHARSRAYRWNEDGLAGICDEGQHLCFALALWNGRDPILKERLFGLTGLEGNHGEDVKERYWYLDSTPTHSYMKMLYRYPQAAFPYERLVEENRRRSKQDREFELDDTGVFDGERYFDVFVEYAKAGPEDVLIRVSVINRGPEAAPVWVLPTAWFRNTWSWGRTPVGVAPPLMRAAGGESGPRSVQIIHSSMGVYRLVCEDADALLFTHNDTNASRLFGAPNSQPYVKDAFHRYVIEGDRAAVNPAGEGSKAAALLSRVVGPGETLQVRLRLTRASGPGEAPGAALPEAPFGDFDALFAARLAEADAFYDELQSWSAACASDASDVDALRAAQRQALAGLMWSKQYYNFDVKQWLEGDPGQPPPPESRKAGRNARWRHINNGEVLAVPDAWEYPWYASWDLGFHCVALALVDAEFAKGQLELIVREWYQHPNGQVPAYEWAFGDVNPPVLAWAAWRVFEADRAQRQSMNPRDRGDLDFLKRVFHKLLLDFTWWVNRKDSQGNNVFEGGFLGLDNIGVFDRGAPLPTGGQIEQSDGTGWMGAYCLNLMRIALELALSDRVYEDIASKFFEHFLYIADAMNTMGAEGDGLWDDEDEFYYDTLRLPDGRSLPLKVRSMVGLIPLFATETIAPETLAELPGFRSRLGWFLRNRSDLAGLISHWELPGAGALRLVALTRGHRMKRLLARALDPAEFLSDYGLRSLSRIHAAAPYTLSVGDAQHTVAYEPAESRTGVFGGNSNWRGPVWFPLNYLLIESLRKFHAYYGDDFKVECPTGSGNLLTLAEIADMLARRLIALFVPGPDGVRPSARRDPADAPERWRPHILFHEYFDGDTGAGLGASHQTGWTALVAELIQRYGAAWTRAL